MTLWQYSWVTCPDRPEHRPLNGTCYLCGSRVRAREAGQNEDKGE